VSVSTEVVPFTFSWFNVQTPVGVTHNTFESSNCNEKVPSLEVEQVEVEKSDVLVSSVCNGVVVLERKKRKRHEHLSDWCSPGALNIVNEGIHNLTDPKYGICSVKRVLSLTESINRDIFLRIDIVCVVCVYFWFIYNKR
jgi:hypothetical protein